MLTQMMCNQKMLLLPEAEINLYLQVLAGVMIIGYDHHCCTSTYTSKTPPVSLASQPVFS